MAGEGVPITTPFKKWSLLSDFGKRTPSLSAISLLRLRVKNCLFFMVCCFVERNRIALGILWEGDLSRVWLG